MGGKFRRRTNQLCTERYWINWHTSAQIHLHLEGENNLEHSMPLLVYRPQQALVIRLKSDPFFDTRNLGSTPKIEGSHRIWLPPFYGRSVRIIDAWESSKLSTHLSHSLPRVERRRLSRGISEIHAHWLAGHISTFPEQCVQPCWKRPHRDPSAWKAIRHFQERFIPVDSLAHQSRPTTFFSL